ncbi:TD and POZ domain-containing protein 4 [Argiope bruennichi]|uniref:TD and POZ domain-containing protein 4 n=1 Tax=Argiope bruennichi TaxID=94029 RepID=A0A8T0FP10_ARGBR|nr:TD and POZ domain-containing protein 4 [Argiope bruennichi]
MAESNFDEIYSIPIDNYMRTSYQKKTRTFKLSVGDSWKISGRVSETKFSSFSTSDNICKIKKYGEKDIGDILLVEIISSEEIHCEIFVCDPNEKLLKTSRAKSYHHIEFHYIFNLSGIHVERLLNAQDYELTVIGVIRLIKRSEITEICSFPSRSVPAFDYMKKLADKLKSSDKTSLEDQILLKANEDSKLVNKSILRAVSPIFDEMLTNKTKKELKIDNMSAAVLKSFVHFLYTGLIFVEDFESLCELYCVGHIYKVCDLQYACGDQMWSRMTVQNVCQLYIISDCVDDEPLKSYVKKFILVYFEKVVQTTGWKSMFLQKPNLALEIINSHDSTIQKY